MKIGIEDTYLNIIKAIYDKPTANFTLDGENLKVFSLNSETRERSPLSLLLFNIILEVLATEIRRENRNKQNPDQEKAVQLSLFTDDMILYIENPKDTTRKLLELLLLLSHFSRVQL